MRILPRSVASIALAGSLRLLLVATATLQGCAPNRPPNRIDDALDALVCMPVEIINRTPVVPDGDPLLRPLIEAGRQNLPYLVEKLAADDMRVRMYCAYALGEIGDTCAAKPLMVLLEEIQTSTHGSSMWRAGVERAAIVALTKIKYPAVSAYALQKILSMLSMRDWDSFLVRGGTYARILRAQGVEADIRRAIEALQVQRTEGPPNRNIDAALQVLSG